MHSRYVTRLARAAGANVLGLPGPDVTIGGCGGDGGATLMADALQERLTRLDHARVDVTAAVSS